MTRINSFLSKNAGNIVSIIGYSVFIIMLFTYLNFLTYMMLVFVLIMLPVVIVGLFHRDMKLAIKRIKSMSWALILVIILLFPAFWLIPQQIYTRINRQSELITPNAPLVQQFASDFQASNPDFNTLTIEEKTIRVKNYTLERVVWKLDYETYGMSGHVATPSQCILLGADDCQGQAVTMASLFINLGFEYVWAVETPFHWYVIIRDPSKGALDVGWERNVENLMDSGELITVNRAGHTNSMPEWSWEEVVMIFNDKVTLFPVDPLEAMVIALTTGPYFHRELVPVFASFDIVLLILVMILLGLLATGWTSYIMYNNPKLNEGKRDTDKREYLFKTLVIGALFFIVMAAWVLLSFVIMNLTLVISIINFGVILALASEGKFWRIIRVSP